MNALISQLLISVTLTASPPSEAPLSPLLARAEALIQDSLLRPLQVKEAKRSRLSRALLPPLTRRVRMKDSVPHVDAKGDTFVTFSIDEYLGGFDDSSAWRADSVTGCAYPDRGEVFISRRDAFVAASVLLGKRTPAPPRHLCISVTADASTPGSDTHASLRRPLEVGTIAADDSQVRGADLDGARRRGLR
jgi:hypothetical protein